MKNINFVFLIGSVLIVSLFNACSEDQTYQETELDRQLVSIIESTPESQGSLDYFTFPVEDEYEAIPQDPKNSITKEKVTLGKFLFHETGLAQKPVKEMGRGSYSCASCHQAEAGFQANRHQGLSEGGLGFGYSHAREKSNLYKSSEVDVQPIRTPSSLNIAYQINVLWNGQFGATGENIGTADKWSLGTPKEMNLLGFEGTETQAIAGLDVHRMIVDEELITNLGYKEMFDAAFSNIEVSERYNNLTAGLAIAAYERTQLASEAPFQKWLRGEFSAMSRQEKEGALVFFGVGECTTCHSGPSLANMEFHSIGFSDLFSHPYEVFQSNINSSENLGRAGFTGDESDKYKFKVPQLYNLKDSPFYGHGSSFSNIKSILEYKNKAVKQNERVSNDELSEFFHPLDLNDEQIENLEAFISESLYDNNLSRYVPELLPSGNCFPNADGLSKYNLGCQ